MRNRLFGLILAMGATVVAVPAATLVAQQARGNAPAAAQKLPPLVYVCNMPGDEGVLEDKPGVCPNPKCGMPLEPIRLDSKWWCPVHQSLEVHDEPGKCRRDGRDLVQVTLREYWTCPGSDNKLNDPGTCPGGAPRKIAYEIRAHGDHNPRHGGQFFMAEDKWHHIEGAYPSAGLFRVYFYDNFTKPMSAKDFSGNAVILDQSFKEIASYPLKLGADGMTMEAQIPAANAKLPLNAAARIAFGPNMKPQLFNFPFNAYSKDPQPAAPAAAAPKPQGALRQAAPFAASMVGEKPFSFRSLARAYDEPAAAQAPAAGAQQEAPRILDSPLQISAELANALDEEKLPKSVPELLTTLTSRLKEIDTLVNEGNLGQAWLPAMGTKTVALVLSDQAKTLPEHQRAVATAAAGRVITSAWEIDAYGDLGNLQAIVGAFKRMTSAVDDLKGAYATAR